MKAHELARRLLDGPDVEVVIRGYEGGVNSVEEVQSARIHVDYHLGRQYVGRHEICEDHRNLLAPADYCPTCENLKEDHETPVMADAVRLTGSNPVGRR